MKKTPVITIGLFVVLITIVILLVQRHQFPTEIEADLVEISESTPLSTVYYYDINGTWVNASSGFTPCTLIEDRSVYVDVNPLFGFTDGTDTVWLSTKEVSDFYSEQIDTLFSVSTSKQALENFRDCLITPELNINYIELSKPQMVVAQSLLNVFITEQVSGYDSSDIIMYALVQLQDKSYIAVVLRDLGYAVQYDYIKECDFTCSLRDDNMTLLIEDTGDLYSLQWELNNSYVPVTEEIP